MFQPLPFHLPEGGGVQAASPRGLTGPGPALATVFAWLRSGSLLDFCILRIRVGSIKGFEATALRTWFGSSSFCLCLGVVFVWDPPLPFWVVLKGHRQEHLHFGGCPRVRHTHINIV